MCFLTCDLALFYLAFAPVGWLRKKAECLVRLLSPLPPSTLLGASSVSESAGEGKRKKDKKVCVPDWPSTAHLLDVLCTRDGFRELKGGGVHVL